MSSEWAAYLNDVSIALVRRVNRVDRLYDMCDQCNGDVAALQALRAEKGIDENTRDALVGVLGRPETELRWIALSALRTCFADDPTLRDIFIAKLEDRSHEVREAAIRALTESFADDEVALTAVIDLMHHEDADTRATAIFRLGKNGSETALNAVRAALAATTLDQLHDRYWLLRALNYLASVHSLHGMLPDVVQIGDELSQASLQRDVQQEAKSHLHGIMYQVLQFVMRYGDAGQLHHTIELASSFNAPMLKSILADASEQMASLDAADDADVADLLTTPHNDTMRAQLLLRLQRLLASPDIAADKLATPTMRAGLIHLASGSDESVQPLAVEVLIHLFATDAALQSELLKLAQSPQPAVRDLALHALTDRFADSGAVVRLLARLMAQPDADLRAAAIAALGRLHTPLAAKMLIVALQSNTFDVVDVARLASALGETAPYVDLRPILSEMNELVYRLPLHPSPSSHVVMDHGFAGILDYMRIYADRHSLEILMRYAGQFSGTHTERAVKDVRAAINNPASRPRIPEVAVAEVLEFVVKGPLPQSAPLDPSTVSDKPSTSPFTTPSHPSPSKKGTKPLSGADEITKVHEHIAGILTHNDRSAVPQLATYVSHSSRAVRIAAIRALGELRDGRGRLALEQATRDPNAAIRKLARDALEKLEG